MSKNESVKASLELYKGLIYLLITGIFAICGFLLTIINQQTFLI
ncbi:MAG: hypothetical protein SO038_06985 [Campylobacter sp.]|nr:hypothetical protein [Campylobacter sp.]